MVHKHQIKAASFSQAVPIHGHGGLQKDMNPDSFLCCAFTVWQCGKICGVDTINVNTHNAMWPLFFGAEKGGHSQSITQQSPWQPGSVDLVWLKASYLNSSQFLKCWVIWRQSMEGFSTVCLHKQRSPGRGIREYLCVTRTWLHSGVETNLWTAP